MKTILVFEWMMSGGLLVESAAPDPNCPFQSQGRSMIEAVVHDFAHAGHHCVVPVDSRLRLNLPETATVPPVVSPDLETSLRSLANGVDFILIIAPECKIPFPDQEQHCLEQCVLWLQSSQHKLISPDQRCIQIASNKTATCELLQQNSVPVPKGLLLSQYLSQNRDADLNFPCVVKPNDGAGSDRVRWIDAPLGAWPADPNAFRIEEFCCGQPASCSVLSGPNGTIALPPMYQHFSEKPIGEFSHATPINEPELQQRASKLALAAAKALPEPRGYIGVDLILGPTEDQDKVIEINPRLTSSYKAISDLIQETQNENLAQKMMKIAVGTQTVEA